MKCSMCGRPIPETAEPFFWGHSVIRVKIETGSDSQHCTRCARQILRDGSEVEALLDRSHIDQ